MTPTLPAEAAIPAARASAAMPSSYSRVYAWAVFALTFGLMLSDYLSRQVIGAVFPALKAEWALSDSQLGMLVSVVSLDLKLALTVAPLLALAAAVFFALASRSYEADAARIHAARAQTVV